MPAHRSVFGGSHFQAAVQLGRRGVKLGSWKTAGKRRYGRRRGIWAGTGPHGGGMTAEPRQPVPDVIASSLKRWPHGAAPGQLTADPRAGHVQRHGARCR